MTRLTIHPTYGLHGQACVPGDKSISHRALLLGALAEGRTRICGFLPGGDCLATLGCLRALGIEVSVENETTVEVEGRGLRGLHAPAAPLNCVRSGTTMRLLAGLMAGQAFDSVLTGEDQLLRRPMRRVAEPLRQMGAEIETTDGHAPILIRGRSLHGFEHRLPVASAQVKSALLLAGLYADSPTSVLEPGPARDHTERMLRAMGAAISADAGRVRVAPAERLAPLDLQVPADLSSAAYPLAAALLAPRSHVMLDQVGVNPTRTGLLDVLRQMGADIELVHRADQGGEPVGDLTASTSRLRGTEVSGETVVRMIDEFPILAVVATQAEGVTVVRDAAELRVKETDRIATIVQELGSLGARIEARPDGFLVGGATPLTGGTVHSHGDHRLAMALAVAGLVAEGEVVVQDAGCIADSFPGFVELMQSLGARYDG